MFWRECRLDLILFDDNTGRIYTQASEMEKHSNETIFIVRLDSIKYDSVHVGDFEIVTVCGNSEEDAFLQWHKQKKRENGGFIWFGNSMVPQKTFTRAAFFSPDKKRRIIGNLDSIPTCLFTYGERPICHSVKSHIWKHVLNTNKFVLCSSLSQTFFVSKDTTLDDFRNRIPTTSTALFLRFEEEEPLALTTRLINEMSFST
jgi:hypothetical protein